MAPERFMFSQPPLVFQVLSWASRPLLSWKWVVEIAGVHILPPVCRIKSLDHWCSNWWFGQRGNSGKQTNKPMNRWTCHCCFRVLEVDVGASYNQLQFFSWVQSDNLSTDFMLSLNQASKVKTLTKTIKTQQQKIVRTLQTVELRCSFAHTFQSAQSAQFAMMVHPVPSSAVAVVASDALSGSGWKAQPIWQKQLAPQHWPKMAKSDIGGMCEAIWFLTTQLPDAWNQLTSLQFCRLRSMSYLVCDC